VYFAKRRGFYFFKISSFAGDLPGVSKPDLRPGRATGEGVLKHDLRALEGQDQ
jgi:hypothetical protein